LFRRKTVKKREINFFILGYYNICFDFAKMEGLSALINDALWDK
jgi:hypothetical protein